jgi:hypothetical protein
MQKLKLLGAADPLVNANVVSVPILNVIGLVRPLKLLKDDVLNTVPDPVSGTYFEPKLIAPDVVLAGIVRFLI